MVFLDCEICGSKNGYKKAEIEGVILNVCGSCVKLGKEIPHVITLEKRRIVKKIPELDSIIREDFSEIVRKEREKRNLTQEILAKTINEKSSIIKRIEEGWEPPLGIIRKLERFFKLELMEKTSEIKTESKDKENLTIGDIIEIN